MDVIEIGKFEKSLYSRDRFDCGVEVLNQYCQKRLNKEQGQHLCTGFVASYTNEQHPRNILGYYTLSSSQLAFKNAPEESVKRVPPTYPIPTQRIGRLARDMRVKGKNMGDTLLSDALRRIIRISESTGVYGIEVDAKDDKAAKFYESYGFVRLKHAPDCLFMPIKTLVKTLL